MKTRLLELRNTLNLNQTDFGKKIGLSTASVSALESGLRNITDRHIMLLCSEFNVNEHWLRTGEGEMFVQSETFSLDEYAKQKQLTELELSIIKSYMDLDTDVRRGILALAQQMLTNNKETTASVEKTPEELVEEEVAKYRLEMLAELQGETLSASAKPRGKLG